MSAPCLFQVFDRDSLPVYPLGPSDRIDSHWFIPWERRRWLNSAMRLKGRRECRALYFDLINISYDGSPPGTVPSDAESLAALLMVSEREFREMCMLEYGPLHRWQAYRCGDDVRLAHQFVVEGILEALGRKEDNRARVEAAASEKRLRRLRVTLAGLSTELAKNDYAVRWIDDFLVDSGCRYRDGRSIDGAVRAWIAYRGNRPDSVRKVSGGQFGAQRFDNTVF